MEHAAVGNAETLHFGYKTGQHFGKESAVVFSAGIRIPAEHSLISVFRLCHDLRRVVRAPLGEEM